MDSNAIKLEKHRGVYWLPGMATETLNGVPLSSNPETASTAIEETVISATDPDITTQLDGSEETRKHKHKTLPRNVNRDTSRSTSADHTTEWKGSGTCTQTSGKHARR